MTGISVGKRVKVYKMHYGCGQYINMIGEIIDKVVLNTCPTVDKTYWTVEFDDGRRDVFYTDELFIPKKVKQQ